LKKVWGQGEEAKQNLNVQNVNPADLIANNQKQAHEISELKDMQLSI
jgi:hypothetical protein